MMRPTLLALLCIPLLAQAQNSPNVRVGTKPTAVFTPTAGGYILRQPGPAANISLTPQPVNPPSSGIPGRGAFSGGKKFRLNGADFEMGAKYDMPIPKTNQKAEVTAISKIPKNAVAKSLLKAMPLIGNAIAIGEILNAVRDEWDATDPPGGSGTVVDTAKGEVYRNESQTMWEMNGKKSGSPAGACNAYFQHIEQTPGGPVTRTATADLLDPVNQTYACRYTYEPAGQGYMGSPNKVESPPQKKLAPEPVLDDVADSMTDSQTGQLLDAAQDGPNADRIPMDIPADAPTEVTGPSSVPSKTTTTSKSDGSSVSTTTSTVINYLQNNITINQQTTTTNRAPDNSVTGSETTTTADETPTDPNPTTPGVDPTTGEPTPGLCELYPDILACKKLEAPPEEPLPKETRNIELQTGPTFAGGGCIPDVNVSVFGHQVTALAMAVPCGWISDYLKPFILLLASLSAVFIIYPKSD